MSSVKNYFFGKKSPSSSRRLKKSSASDLAVGFTSEALPSIAAIALQVVHAAGRKNSTSREIIDLLSQDPVLSAKLMKAVNSCVYGLSYPVSSLDQAVHILGLNPLRSLVLGLALPTLHAPRQIDQSTREYWLTSVSGAMFARELAVRQGSSSPEDDLVAGLLRDLGQLLLRQKYPDQWRSVYEAKESKYPDLLISIEKSAFDCDHADLTSRILKNWNLPNEIVEPIRFHHNPSQAKELSKVVKNRTELLNFVEHLTHLDLIAEDPVRLRHVLTVANDRYKLTKDELVKFLEQIAPKITEFASLLEVDITKYPDFSRILTIASETLVGLTVEANREILNATTSQTCTNESPLEPLSSVDSVPVNSLSECTETNRKGKTVSTPVKMILPSAGSGSSIKKEQAQFDNPRYAMIERIGEGGMGQVYRAEHKLMGRIVAIKVVSPKFLAVQETIERFRREVRLAARLHHPNIVTAYDADEIDGCQCLVMEYVNGSSLDRYVSIEGPLSTTAACRIIRQAALGLQYAYEQGMVHRDIKPHNIILASDGQVKILDFGLARLNHQTEEGKAQPGLTGPESVVGTPDYMSPEQARDSEGVDHRGDIYALGCTLFFLLTGRPPFCEGTARARMIAHVQDKPPRISQFRDDVPIALQTILDRAMEKNPDKRYQVPSDFAAVLFPFTEEGEASVAEMQNVNTSQDRVMRLVLMSIVIIGLLLAAAAGGAFIYSWFIYRTPSIVNS